MSETPQLAETTLTPLAALSLSHQLETFMGCITPATFSDTRTELAALLKTAAVYDLGYLMRIRITGEDRVRWLNGMVTNTVQSLPQGYGNYTFILNAQGRIQGDAHVFQAADHLLLETDRAQSARLLAHFDHFIIMDDVVLEELDERVTTLGLSGPQAPEILSKLGLPVPENFAFAEGSLEGIPVNVIHAYSLVVPRFELWLSSSDLPKVWQAITTAGALPAGFEAVESLRILEGTPRFGADITDRYLPQETSQTRVLNFNKGCYLGQEIVERIRSRATIHRSLRQFELQGTLPAPGTELFAEGDTSKAIGEITSAALYEITGVPHVLALGYVRTEAIERKSTITYSGGKAVPLATPPLLN